jgi:uncharacterized membrane protein YbhN (UPF0104 family)
VTSAAATPEAQELSPGGGMPAEFQPARLRRHVVLVLGALAILVLIALLAPGLGDVRSALADASPWWIAVAIALEVASCLSYVLIFRPVFCDRMPWRRSLQIGLAEVATGSIIPASGAGGLALGAWVLHRGGMPAERIARRSVAFFLIKSSVNFVAVAVIGVIWAIGLIGPDISLVGTALPAAAAILVIALVLLVPRLGPGTPPGPDAGKTRRAISAARRSLIGGTHEAVELVRSRDLTLLAGAIGYWLFDNLALLAAYAAVGHTPALSIVLMGYLIGQLGGLLPLPGGVGGIDGGLIGVLVLYGAAVAPTVAAVLAYRLILFWVPLIVGAPAFFTLWRRMTGRSLMSPRSTAPTG